MPQRGQDAVNIDRSAIRLTDAILGYDARELGDALKAIASEIDIRHIAYLPFASNKNCEPSLATAVVTYSTAWRTHYFLNDYLHIDPVVAHGRNALLPFDWKTLSRDGPAVAAFFADAARHGVGRNGLSIPVRCDGARALVSFTSDHEATEWNRYKLRSMASLQKLSLLIHAAANRNPNLPSAPARLSRREEACLTWAARGKTQDEIADVLEIGSSSVKVHLDVARHKLHCMNLTHAIAVAIATGVISPQSQP
jgi:LuxR family transcriptional regulator, quorum-sensing system regulator RaiR